MGRKVTYRSGEVEAEGAKPCPFCGDVPHWRGPPNYSNKWMLSCDNPACHVAVYGATSKTQKAALRKWNKRAKVIKTQST